MGIAVIKDMETEKARQTGNFVLVLTAMVLGVLIGLMFASNNNRHADGTLEGKVSEVMKLVESEYIKRCLTDETAFFY